MVLGRHTTSESTIIQMIGRGLRKHESKLDCLVLDYSGRKDMEDIIHYWRIDEAREKGAGNSRQPERKDPEELQELSVQFAKRISPWGRTQVEYSWFRPYGTRPLLALALWTEPSQADRYLTVEPLKDGQWRVSTVTLNTSGPTPVTKRQNRARTEEDALSIVRSFIGENPRRLRRDAPWRGKAASENQKKVWRSLNGRNISAPAPAPEPEPSLAGEISDSIAMKRFQIKVSPELI